MPLKPLLSVIIPMRAGHYPQKAISCLARARLLQGPLEIIVVEGQAPSWQRNEAAKSASADILYFLDDDSCVHPDAIREGLQFFCDPKVAVVGGPAITDPEASLLEKCIGEVFGSYFGGCITRARSLPIGDTRAVEGEELVLCNLMIRKTCYEEVSGLDTRLYPGEDPEFLKRLNARGALMYYHPNLLAFRRRRNSVAAFMKQGFRYGRGRGLHILEGTRPHDLLFFAPLLFLLYIFTLLFTQSTLLLFPFWTYLALAAVSSISVAARTRSLPMGLGAFPLFPILHISYAVGMARGLYNYLRRRSQRNISPVSLTILRLAPDRTREVALAASARAT